ncbi:class F sortase [Streptomyces sp. NPDC002990]
MHGRKILTAGAAVSGCLAMAAGWALLGSPYPAAEEGALPATRSTVGTQPSLPVLIRGPKGLQAKVNPVAARPDGSLALPEEGPQSGWWALGATPGAARGTVLIAGHVDTQQGLGAFSTLHALGLGSVVHVTGANGRVYRYQITARRTYPRTRLPADLFSTEGAHRLALVTCSGAYDHHTRRYANNLVLYARLTTPTSPQTR